MVYTAQALIRELGERWGDYALVTANVGGSTTVLKTDSYTQWAPSDILKLNVWVYGSATADTGNRTYERRIASWDSTNRQFTLHYPGFPAACTTGDYELHARTRRVRKLAALNSAIRELDLHWFREVIDQTITTSANTWTYTLSSAVNWGDFPRLQIQINTDTSLTGFPYVDATEWNYEFRHTVSAAGVEAWTLQFARQPPPGRILRIFGEVGYTSLAADADILPVAGAKGEHAYEWLLDYAQFQLALWELNRQPAGQADRYKALAQVLDTLQKTKVLTSSQTHKNANIIVPGKGTGEWPYGSVDSDWLAAMRTLH